MNQVNENKNVEVVNNEKNNYVLQQEEYTGRSINLLNQNEINHCLEYVDDDYKERFLKTMKELESFNIKYVGRKPFDEDDSDSHNTYKVIVKRADKRVNLATFKQSTNDTYNNIQPSLYDILTCLKMDGTTETDNFTDFCHEFGYDVSNYTKAQKIFKAIIKEKEKLFKIFSYEELESFPQ